MKNLRNQINMFDDVDKYELERKKREAENKILKLDEKYRRIHFNDFKPDIIPPGTVVIVMQTFFRNDHLEKHFYRCIVGYHDRCHADNVPHVIESITEQWPERPPWADVVGHEDEPRDCHIEPGFEYWLTDEVAEPIIRWIDKLGVS